ncbi:MAG: cysteine synthase A [Desulfovibrionaceae bacterium]|nr:cysteine synthase A [Desulfovibrionaceae bacterium]
MLTNILQNIGNTPLLRLNRLAKGLPGQVWVKLESCNPGGSIKDRIAFHMVERALERGDLARGGTIVEPTSGNTGVGLALIAAVRGLTCVLTMPENMSIERRKLLAQYGAELVLTPAAEGMGGAVAAAERIVRERGAVMLGQFTNVDAVEAHYVTTGPEIYSDSMGEVHALVAGVGSGSSITGTGRFLKENIDGFRVIAVEPADSPLLSTGKAGPHTIQGIGANFVPPVLDRDLLDEILTVTGDDALATARALFRQEGISCGISSGANVRAALQVASRPEMQGKRIVTFICDGGERYMSTALFA